MIKLALVVPCYNEEAVLPAAIARLTALRDELVGENLIDADSSITFVDDGSTDRTWPLIESAAANDAGIHGIKLAKNRGHQNALIAGLLSVSGDVLISIDADLQDDPARSATCSRDTRKARKSYTAYALCARPTPGSSVGPQRVFIA